ncbi:hypothetical protein [Metabacillus sp. SLBN-84]
MKNSKTFLQDLLNQKDDLQEIADHVKENTQRVFSILVTEIKKQLGSVSHGYSSIRRDSDSILEFELSGTTIGLAIVEGTSLIRDEKLFAEEFYEEQRMKSYKDIIHDENLVQSFTGMIVMYVKVDAASHVVLSRFYVNKHQETIYRSEVGWYNRHIFTSGTLVDEVGDYLLRSIQDAFFEFKTYWNNDQREFINISDLREPSNIGFK